MYLTYSHASNLTFEFLSVHICPRLYGRNSSIFMSCYPCGSSCQRHLNIGLFIYVKNKNSFHKTLKLCSFVFSKIVLKPNRPLVIFFLSISRNQTQPIRIFVTSAIEETSVGFLSI